MRGARSLIAGFTLLEMSIVLLIISVLAGGAAASLNLYVQRQQMSETLYKMRVLQDALLQYRLAFDRLPCPANGSYATSSQYYGKEAATPGTCSGGTPASSVTGNYAFGTLPSKTLGLPDDAAVDGWGRKIGYVVDKRATANTVFAPTSYSQIANPDTTARLTVQDAAGNSLSTVAMYVMISYGPNGHGANARSGAVVNAASGDSAEQTNCECGVTGVYDGSVGGTYIQKSATATFDDMVVFGTRATLRSYSE